MPRAASRSLTSGQSKEYLATFAPHRAQYDFMMDPHRFRVLACGRRFGKTMVGISELLRVLQAAKEPHPIGWVVAPNYPLSIVDWDTAIEMFGPLVLQQNSQDHWMEVYISADGKPRTAKIEFKTAEREDKGLRGRGLSGLLMDEASLIGTRAWELGLRPALADKQGRAIVISTPRGTGGLFYDLFQLGQGNHPDWKSWRFPSNANPYFPPEEWAELEKITPSGTWRQEYLAEFVEGEGAVFHGLDHIRELTPLPYDEKVRWVIGADLAKRVDFTVLYTINEYGEPGDIVRLKEIEWTVQEEAIHRLSQRYGNARVYLDSSGVGDPVESNLRKRGVSVEGVKTGSTVQKEELIQALQIAIDQNWISLPSKARYHWLWDELGSYQREVTEHGNTRYHAPEGSHDDGVIALSLAVHGLGPRLGRMQRKEPIYDPNQSFTKWGDYYAATHPRKKKGVYLKSANRRFTQGFRFREAI